MKKAIARSVLFLVMLVTMPLSGIALASVSYERIKSLGYSDTQAAALSKAVAAGQYDTVTIANPTIATVINVDGTVAKNKKLHWKKEMELTTLPKKYVAGGVTLYHVQNYGKDILFRTDEVVRVTPGKRIAAVKMPEKKVAIPTSRLSAKPKSYIDPCAEAVSQGLPCPEIQKFQDPCKELEQPEQPVQTEPVAEEIPLKVKVEPDWKHEPQVGIYAGQNSDFEWAGAFAKYKFNFGEKDSPLVPGIGFLGNYNWGWAKDSDYERKEYAIGPLFGLKYFWDDTRGYPGMAEFDIAPQVYRIEGENSCSGYETEQTGYKINTRLELKQMVSSKWTLGAVAEGDFDLSGSRDFESTWIGDEVSDRSFYEIGAYGLNRLNYDWQWQAYGGVVHSDWDEMTGIKIIPIELRYHKWLCFGVGTTFYPFGLSDEVERTGTDASDLQSYFGFIRFEFGPFTR